MDSHSLLISRAFWTLFTLEAIACAAFMIWSARSTGSWGPEGPVGAWIIYVFPPILLGIPLAVVLIGRSKAANLVGLYVLCWPLVPLVVGPIYSTLNNLWGEHRIAGDFTFLAPSQRQLAHALRVHDAAAVRNLLPNAGNLNVKHRGESLFGFGLKNADKSAASLEIVKAMLEAGADANMDLSSDYWPLTAAISYGPPMTQLLIEAGANPNQMEANGRPVWWNVLYDSSPEGFQTLAILVDHGADLTLRDSNGGPVGWSAYQKNWRAVWLMMEHGAAWKGELALGQPIPQELESDLSYRRSSHQEIPEEMEKVAAKYGMETSSR